MAFDDQSEMMFPRCSVNQFVVSVYNFSESKVGRFLIVRRFLMSQQEKAGIEEGKSKKMAEIKDKAETMIASGELVTPNHKGVGQRLKENLICSS